MGSMSRACPAGAKEGPGTELYSGTGRYPAVEKPNAYTTASAPGRSRIIAVRCETGGGSNVSAPSGSAAGSAWMLGRAGMCAKSTGFAQSDQIESAGAQAVKAWCLFIVGLRA